jgi:hypothetical protein
MMMYLEAHTLAGANLRWSGVEAQCSLNTMEAHRNLCWGSVQITKKLCATQPRPKDLSISNAITVGVSDTYPRRTKRGDYPPTKALLSKTIADLKVVKILAQRLRHRMSGTSAYSHMYGDHDDSQNPVSSRDAVVDDTSQTYL